MIREAIGAWCDQLVGIIEGTEAARSLVSLLTEPQHWTAEAVAELIRRLSQIESWSADGKLDRLLPVLESLSIWFHTPQVLSAAARTEFFHSIDPPLSQFYSRLPDAAAARNALLGWLAALRTDESLARLVQWLVNDPPRAGQGIATALAPLLEVPPPQVDLLFPALLEGLEHRVLAAAILDLANHFTRTGKLEEHPARSRWPGLLELLGQVVYRMQDVEIGSLPGEMTQAQLAETVSDSVALIVALCDAAGLIGDRQACGRLHQALELKHRRIQTEAAAALARLGDPRGPEVLVELAAQPVARLRVLAYADELGLRERIPESFRSESAIAESELAVWLSEPERFGIPPLRLELFDERELYWPGYDQPQRCYLFRYFYPAGEQEYSNLGIAGPCVHAIGASLEGYSASDIYALFAGWQAAHADVYEVDVARLPPSARATVERLAGRLRDRGFEEIRPRLMAYFFDQQFLVAAARRQSIEGTAISSRDQLAWIPAPAATPLPAELAYCMFKGRMFLKSFNPAPSDSRK
jgi:hypothetical protein